MIAAVALLALCTAGLGLAIEPMARLSRAAAAQLIPVDVPVVGEARAVR